MPTPQRVRQGMTLGLVFGAVLFAGAASGAWGEPDGSSRAPSSSEGPPHADLAGADLTPQQARQLVGDSGDRWAAYLSPQQYADLTGGRYAGVGLNVDREAGGPTLVAEVVPGSPAARAGIEPGQRLVTVDGAPAEQLPVTELVSRLRGGPAGSTVAVDVRDGAGPVRELTLTRAELSTREVEVEHPAPGVARIAVHAFTEGVAEQVRAAEAGSRGVVLDLRGNSGGLVGEAVDTASVFLDGGPVASYQVHGEHRELTAAPGGDTAVPLVVLVDGGTMSAAELLAGALQDRSRAVLVGSRTFGKGTVQQPSRLADGSVLELTVGRYQTPAGRSPDGTGVQPDVPAAGEDPQALALKVLDGLSGSAPGATGTPAAPAAPAAGAAGPAAP
ncbi:S41 family peptidase [Kitasatospora sp. YST-16]|uniref:S41 family peptidase n=1 Tax=Kitasatospora sp. YST-16 TaxID=2998080 RepID=UPI00228460EA|nr:S41 family peptidase [Kitasatospora sp. YST-16]WAL72005.1 S41 family peptidase [Kitasatospora sp. YST-16]WNW38052.1 S41 family peptidase [Streptomyces sp. Li-HN-5-13]